VFLSAAAIPAIERISVDDALVLEAMSP
jgi:hypothetical protein